jgi:hypothetical protein
MEVPQVIRDLYKYASDTYAKTNTAPKIYYARDEAHYHQIEEAAKSMPIGNAIVKFDMGSNDFFIFRMRVTTIIRERKR